MSDSLREFSKLMDELSALIKEWTSMSPTERTQKEEQFRNRHKDIAARIAKLPKPQGKP